MMYWIGIDPGITGAVAVLSPGAAIRLFDAPFNWTGGRRALSPWHMAQMFEEFDASEVRAVTIEKAQPMPKQGVVSVFNYGAGYGMWIGIVAAREFSYTAVSPRTWKKVMLADTAKDKQASLQMARQLFPERGGQLDQAKHHGRAEALLLAEYGRRTAP